MKKKILEDKVDSVTKQTYEIYIKRMAYASAAICIEIVAVALFNVYENGFPVWQIFLCALTLITVALVQVGMWRWEWSAYLAALIISVVIIVLKIFTVELSVGAFSYFCFLALIPFTGRRVNKWCRHIEKMWFADDGEIERIKMEARIALAALCFAFCFLANLAFAWRIYPYIPATKGGGDYSYNPRVSLSLGARNDLERQLLRENSYVILEQTPTVLYLADVNEFGGPSSWRNMKIENTPKTVEIQRDLVYEIVITPKTKIK